MIRKKNVAGVRANCPRCGCDAKEIELFCLESVQRLSCPNCGFHIDNAKKEPVLDHLISYWNTL